MYSDADTVTLSEQLEGHAHIAYFQPFAVRVFVFDMHDRSVIAGGVSSRDHLGLPLAARAGTRFTV